MSDIHFNESDRSTLRFRTTQWQLVRSAGNDTEEALQHLDRLLRHYLPALNTFLTHRYRLDQATAEDILQGFVFARILHGRLLQIADPERGRFRTVLLTSLTNYVRTELRKLQAAKRIPNDVLVHWDELEDQELRQASSPPEETAFEPSLNCFIVEKAVRKFRKHCDLRGKLVMWEVFENRLLKPILEDVAPESYDRLMSRLQLSSHSQATNLLMSAKRSFIRTLKEVINEFALSHNDAEAELKMLLRFCQLDTR